jgi:outer membrane lipoprotein carrier protein
MKKIISICLLILSPLVFGASAAEEVQAKLNAIKTLRANFKQKVTAGKRTISTSSGNMALARPGKFLWKTKKPMEQTVIADGKQIWVYDVDLEQVTVKKQQKGLGGTPGLFLSGYGNTVTRDFEVKAMNQNTYELKAKSPKENYQRLRLTFSGENLTNIEFFDQLGQHTDVQLIDVKQSPGLESSLFKFVPPKGVDIVRE